MPTRARPPGSGTDCDPGVSFHVPDHPLPLYEPPIPAPCFISEISNTTALVAHLRTKSSAARSIKSLRFSGAVSSTVLVFLNRKDSRDNVWFMSSHTPTPLPSGVKP